jgi:hypothetical protein
MSEIDQSFIEELAKDPAKAQQAHRDNAAKLLEISVKYCQEFVPEQAKQFEDHLLMVNKLLDRCGSASDLQSLTAAKVSLIKGYASLLEQGTVIYMANSRPLINLLSSHSVVPPIAKSEDDKAEIADDSEELDDFDPSEFHKPYTTD